MITFYFDQIKISNYEDKKTSDIIFNIVQIDQLAIKLKPESKYQLIKTMAETSDLSSIQIEEHVLSTISKAVYDSSAIYLFIQLIRLSKNGSVFSPLRLLSDRSNMDYDNFLSALATLEEFNLIKIHKNAITEISLNRSWLL